METIEVAIVGAGPAGLTAALYAARFCRTTIVLHDGQSRASWITRTNNVPGFADGVGGPELLDLMSRHAQRYGAKLVDAHIVTAERHEDGFRMTAADGRCWHSRTLIIATGVKLHTLPMDKAVHDHAVAAGLVRYCPICDGYEHRNEKIAVVGGDLSGAAEALFLRQYSSDVTLVPSATIELDSDEQHNLAAAGVAVLDQPATAYLPGDEGIAVTLADGNGSLRFDVIYPALGVTPRHELAEQLGLPLTDEGNTAAASMLSGPIAGVFCAGDIVDGLDQIAVAMGEGAVAATEAHNWLREQDRQTVDAITDDSAV